MDSYINELFDLPLEKYNAYMDLFYATKSTTYVNEAFVNNFNLYEGHIYFSDYPFLDLKNNYKNRPCLIIGNKNNFECVMISSSYGKSAPKVNGKFSFIVQNHLQYGLPKPSFVACNVILPEPLVNLKNRIGKFDSKSMSIIKRLISEFKKFRVKTPWLFLDYIKMIQPSYKKQTKVQSLSKIKKCKSSSQLSINNALHMLCVKYMIDHRIFYIEDGSSKFVGILFELNGLYQSFRFIFNANNELRGEIFVFKKNAFNYTIITLDTLFIIEANQLRNELNISNKMVGSILSIHEMKVWDKVCINETEEDVYKYLHSITYIKNMFKILSSYTYGNEDGSHILKKKEFENSKCGNCWDYSVYIFNEIKSNCDTSELCFWFADWISDNEYHTHTWVSYRFMHDNMIYVIECAYKPHQDIHIFNSEQDMLNKYREILPHTEPKVFEIRKFTSCQAYGTDYDTFLKYLQHNGKVVYRDENK